MEKISKEKEKQVGTFKGWILGIINGIDPRMLVDMIKANNIPTLWEYELPPYLPFVKGLIQEYLPQILEQLTVEAVIDNAKIYRPDLAKILSHQKARIWMNRFLKKTKFMLENLDKDAYEIQALYNKKMDDLRAARDAKEAKMVDKLLQNNEEKKIPTQHIEIIPTEEVEKQLTQQEIEEMSDGLTEKQLKMVLGNKFNDDLDFV